MPSPKAVLADITDFALDHNKAHRSVGASGRLKIPSSPNLETTKASELVRSGFVKLAPEETQKIDEMTNVQEETTVNEKMVVSDVNHEETEQSMPANEPTEQLVVEPLVTETSAIETTVVEAPVVEEKKSKKDRSKKSFA